ncbi:hypothetical protein HFO39_23505 [Rhizobium leguminosarum]|uniref:DegT/DnrJ/EryC1/StrS family aminotransferase n=1 Tax=Rhizobium leguminosarum TaxID=384 RepID=UPI001C969930|nr:DegT/DnrJ/EryC1/StrS family aminotransferase [Rhizobium leguminosarum]MBY5637698.1 hypothetical protein [Rhizobium leguminosarum]
MPLWPFHSPDALASATAVMAAPDLGAVNHHASVKKFEEGFVSWLRQPSGNAAFFNSGTSALCAAIFALQLPRGSEIIVPSSTFRSTVTPLFQFGLIPVIVSCDRSTMSIDADEVLKSIGPNTKAIVVNHQWGLPVDGMRLAEIAREHHLYLVEDASHAHATTIYGKPAGTLGDVSVFSCGTTKMVSGGLGGILYTRDKSMFDRSMLYGLAKHRVLETAEDKTVRLNAAIGLGINLRGHPVAAELAFGHLNRIREIVGIKNRNVTALAELLTAHCPAIVPFERPLRWTGGTWYKLPCSLRSKSLAMRASKIGKALGLRIEACHENIGRQLDKYLSDRRLLNNLTLKYIDNSNDTFAHVILFDTRDMYDENINFEPITKQLIKLHDELMYT